MFCYHVVILQFPVQRGTTTPTKFHCGLSVITSQINIVWIPNLPQPVKGEEGGASLSLSGKRDRGVW